MKLNEAYADGNLTSDGNRNFAWTEDGERSTQMAQRQGRCGRSPTRRVSFGRAFGNLIATFTLSDLQTFELSKTHTWGLDLSQSLQGAGGVGGLLSVEEISGTHADVYHFAFDANGNVNEVLDAVGGLEKLPHMKNDAEQIRMLQPKHWAKSPANS